WQLKPFTVTVSGANIVDFIGAGNPITAALQIGAALARDQPLNEIFWELLRDYAIFHLLVAAGCTAGAVAKLRPVGVAQAGGAVGVRRRRPWRAIVTGLRPRIGNFPMLWKELFAEPKLRPGPMGRILLALLLVLSLVPAGIIVYYWAADLWV